MEPRRSQRQTCGAHWLTYVGISLVGLVGVGIIGTIAYYIVKGILNGR